MPRLRSELRPLRGILNAGPPDVGEWYVAEGDHDRAGKDQLGHASAVLIGRKTYEGLAAYWTPLTDD